MDSPLWLDTTIGDDSFSLLNLDHPQVEARVIAEMETGVEVYYDRRWSATAVLTDWLANHLAQIRGKKVLILGAGVGAETLLAGQYASHVWINDLAPAALELCAQQMEENQLANFTLMTGRYEDLSFPPVDLIIGSFLIYNKDTLAAMEAFLSTQSADVILVNETLAPFPKFLKTHPHREIFRQGAAIGALFPQINS